MDDHRRKVEHAADLCKRLITCVNRLGQLIVMNAPEQIIRNEFKLIASLADDWLREHGYSNNPGSNGE
jgi:hypothetical protein